ncbi:hypothetical protein [uncultured Marivita sp.]|uniref:hypothetical protein n=1 Tax=uncultured Marivita sp. TaxID=888080 RepID=UPI0026298B52|nr:hypothetical protein [uncultured Marivita sp.]
MRHPAVITSVALAMVGGLSGCEAAPTPPARFAPNYEGVQTTLLDGDLVKFDVAMRGARGPSDVEDYAECAAAQYALIRGYGFARHLRTNVYEEAGLWRGDAVYTISPALPRGVRTIDAEVVTASCVENGIPMV